MAYSRADVYQLVLNRGGTPAEADTLSGISALGEDPKGDPNAHNAADPYGGSWGLYQINGVHSLNGGITVAQMTDPVASTDYALSLLRGQGTVPWKGDAYVVSQGGVKTASQLAGGPQSLTNYGGANMPNVANPGQPDNADGTSGAPGTQATPIYGPDGTIVQYAVTDPSTQMTLANGSTVTIPGAVHYVNASAAGGASSHVPTPFGVTPPDALGAANALTSQYAQAIAAGTMTFNQAQAAWQDQFNTITGNAGIDTSNASNKLSADTSNAGNTLSANTSNAGNALSAATTNQNTGTQYMQAGQSRAANIASAQGNLNSDATARAGVIATLLRSALPGGQSLNVVGGAPGAGYLPNQVNVDQMLSQGLPSLASQYGGLQSLFPTIGAAPTISPQVIAPPQTISPQMINPMQAPPAPVPQVLPPQPDISSLINQGTGGSYMGTY